MVNSYDDINHQYISTKNAAYVKNLITFAIAENNRLKRQYGDLTIYRQRAQTFDEKIRDRKRNRDDVHRSDLGLIFGTGFKIGSLTIDARYNYGITEIHKRNLGSWKNSTISIMLGYSF